MRQAAGEPDEGDLVETTRGQWLDQLLQRMREPAQLEGFAVPASIHAKLRPYQETGFSWLSYLQDLGFGACLADDMGLGKTLQMLAFLERLRTQVPSEDGRVRALLVVPASLLGNWERELQKFAPDLDYLMLYGKSARVMNEEWGAVPDDELRQKLPTLCITTYAMALRVELLERMNWDVLVLDEAQAIKNPGVKQTKTLRRRGAAARSRHVQQRHDVRGKSRRRPHPARAPGLPLLRHGRGASARAQRGGARRAEAGREPEPPPARRPRRARLHAARRRYARPRRAAEAGKNLKPSLRG
ncbi:MAG TPA: hypothetical protein DCP91_12965 [Eggerthellaceae bacterium]|nr:hypothetical protein [Eggerthellaceae bacterium]